MVKTDSETIYKVVMLLIKVPSEDLVRKVCVSEFKIPAESVDAIIEEANKKLWKAAEIHHNKELGTAITALRDLYSSNLKIKDYKTALLTRKELNRILGLYENEVEITEADEDEENEQLEEIRRHLEPLQLAPPGTPIVELVRLAVIRIAEMD